MIQINDYDVPIQVAEKIIGGTIEVSASMLDKAAYKAFTGKELGETVHRDMFGLEQIKEIAGYLMVYYEARKAEIESESEEA